MVRRICYLFCNHSVNSDTTLIFLAFLFIAHFGLLKFQSQSSTVPEAAPFYTWKIGVPTFEFGTMHAILYQLAILPLTMCRLLIANFSKTFVSKIIPFDEMTR